MSNIMLYLALAGLSYVLLAGIRDHRRHRHDATDPDARYRAAVRRSMKNHPSQQISTADSEFER